MNRNMPELLAPAGSFDIMKRAFQAGADAVYLGGQFFGARAFASNLTDLELLHAIEYTQLHQKKLYLTVNTLLKNDEIDRLFSYLKSPYEAGLQAVIVQDLGVAELIHRQFPDLELHASTQMSILNAYGAEYLKEMGFTRIVPARELSIQEIRQLKQKSGMELEVFVHGALCYSYSGMCLFSSMIGGRSGNRGRCAQPCRQTYVCINGDTNEDISRTINADTKENTDAYRSGRINKYADAYMNGPERYFLSPRDLCTLEQVPELIQAGVDSFKIEGRMKQAEYVVSAVQAYRQAIDAYGLHKSYPAEQWKETLADIYNRGNFTDGYLHRHNGIDMMSMERNHHNGLKIGTITKIRGGEFELALSRKLQKGDILEVRTRNASVIELTSGTDGMPGQRVMLRGKQLKEMRTGDLVYRTKNPTLCQMVLKKCEAGLKEKIHISVTLKKDFPVMIRMSCNGHRITVSGGMVTTAQKQPLQEAELRSKLKKTGDFPFETEDAWIDIEMEENCFCSMKEFNQLRRRAMEDLQRVCSTQHRRLEVMESEPSPKYTFKPSQASTENADWAALVSTKEQLQAALVCGTISRIELDADYFSVEELMQALHQIQERTLQGYVCLPSIFREDMEAQVRAIFELKADGYVLRTLDELGFAKKCRISQPLVCDSSIYAYNDAAVMQLLQKSWLPDLHLTLPVELCKDELQELINQNPDAFWEWNVYGKQTVMLTTQCTRRNTEGCRKNQPDLTLVNSFRDAYGIHTVCQFCYNKIYQKQPVNLLEQRSELDSVAVYRLRFTDEDEEETLRILQRRMADSDYQGRFRKGME